MSKWMRAEVVFTQERIDSLVVGNFERAIRFNFGDCYFITPGGTLRVHQYKYTILFKASIENERKMRTIAQELKEDLGVEKLYCTIEWMSDLEGEPYV